MPSSAIIAASASSWASGPSGASSPSRASSTSTHDGRLLLIVLTLFSFRSKISEPAMPVIFLAWTDHLWNPVYCQWLHHRIPLLVIFKRGFTCPYQLINDFTDSLVVPISVNKPFYWFLGLLALVLARNCSIHVAPVAFIWAPLYPFMTFCTSNLMPVPFLWNSCSLCYNQITRTARWFPLDKL